MENILHSYDIKTLQDLVSLTDVQLQTMLGLNIGTIDKILLYAELLQRSLIPTMIPRENDYVIWLGPCKENKISLMGMQNQQEELTIFEQVPIDQLIEIVNHYQPVLIGDLDTISQFDTTLSWKFYLHRGIMINHENLHDYIITRIKGKVKRNEQNLDTLQYNPKILNHMLKQQSRKIIHLIEDYIIEIKLIISRIYYLKQARKSSITVSSESSTPSNPPRL